MGVIPIYGCRVETNWSPLYPYVLLLHFKGVYMAVRVVDISHYTQDKYIRSDRPDTKPYIIHVYNRDMALIGAGTTVPIKFTITQLLHKEERTVHRFRCMFDLTTMFKEVGFFDSYTIDDIAKFIQYACSSSMYYPFFAVTNGRVYADISISIPTTLTDDVVCDIIAANTSDDLIREGIAGLLMIIDAINNTTDPIVEESPEPVQ